MHINLDANSVPVVNTKARTLCTQGEALKGSLRENICRAYFKSRPQNCMVGWKGTGLTVKLHWEENGGSNQREKEKKWREEKWEKEWRTPLKYLWGANQSDAHVPVVGLMLGELQGLLQGHSVSKKIRNPREEKRDIQPVATKWEFTCGFTLCLWENVRLTLSSRHMSQKQNETALFTVQEV